METRLLLAIVAFVLIIVILVFILSCRNQGLAVVKKEKCDPVYLYEGNPRLTSNCSCDGFTQFVAGLDNLANDSQGGFAEGAHLTFDPASDTIYVGTGAPNQAGNQYIFPIDVSGPPPYSAGPNLIPTGYLTFSEQILGFVWHPQDQLFYSSERLTGNIYSHDINWQNGTLIGTFAFEIRGFAIDPDTGHLYACDPQSETVWLIDRTDASIINTWQTTYNGLPPRRIGAMTTNFSTGEIWASWLPNGGSGGDPRFFGTFNPETGELAESSCSNGSVIAVAGMTFDNEERLWYVTGLQGEPPYSLNVFQQSPCSQTF